MAIYFSQESLLLQSFCTSSFTDYALQPQREEKQSAAWPADFLIIFPIAI